MVGQDQRLERSTQVEVSSEELFHIDTDLENVFPQQLL